MVRWCTCTNAIPCSYAWDRWIDEIAGSLIGLGVSVPGFMTGVYALVFHEKKEKLLHGCTYIGISHVCIVVHQGKVVGYVHGVKGCLVLLERCTIKYQ